jgi:hypothetical protein
MNLEGTLLETLADQTDVTKEEKDHIDSLTPGHVLMFRNTNTTSNWF